MLNTQNLDPNTRCRDCEILYSRRCDICNLPYGFCDLCAEKDICPQCFRMEYIPYKCFFCRHELPNPDELCVDCFPPLSKFKPSKHYQRHINYLNRKPVKHQKTLKCEMRLELGPYPTMFLILEFIGL